jgi:hypothetical protein
MSEYRDMRPLFSGANVTTDSTGANVVEYNDQRADFFVMTLLEKRLNMLTNLGFVSGSGKNPNEINDEVIAFVGEVGKYHKDIDDESDVTKAKSAAIISEYNKVADPKRKALYNRIFEIELKGGKINFDAFIASTDAAKNTANIKVVADGFKNVVEEAATDAAAAKIAAEILTAYGTGYGAGTHTVATATTIFNINLANLLLKTDTHHVSPAESLIFAESADPEVWVRDGNNLVHKETGAIAGAKNVGNDACAGTKVDGTKEDCTKYVSECLMGQNIDACKAYFASADFYKNTWEEIKNMDPMVAVKMLRKFGFKEVSNYDADKKMNIVTIEPVGKWISGLPSIADTATVSAISSNQQLRQYLDWVRQLVNNNPAILNPGYRGGMDNDSHDPDRFVYTGFAKMGIKARRPVRNSCYRDIDALANAIDQHNITLGIRLNAPIVGGIVPARVMIGGGSLATISQAETSVAQLRSNRRQTSEILSKTFEYLTNKLQAFNKDISPKDKSKINELINDLAKKEEKLYDVIDFVEKYALLVDVFGEKRVAEVVTVDQMKKAVDARAKLFSKKVKRETDIISVLKSLTGAVDNETTESGEGRPAGTAAGYN